MTYSVTKGLVTTNVKVLKPFESEHNRTITCDQLPRHTSDSDRRIEQLVLVRLRQLVVVMDGVLLQSVSGGGH